MGSVDRYIVRISLGLEDGEALMERVRKALRAVERFEGAEAATTHAKLREPRYVRVQHSHVHFL